MQGYVTRNASLFILAFLTIIGTILHFHNLNWGAPFYFNPDERNIANAVTQLHFPNQMNPHFFAYGTLPIYTIYFTGSLSNFLSTFHVSPLNFQLSFSQAILIGRVYSALFANILIPLLYVVSRHLVMKHSNQTDQAEKAGLLAAFLATFSTGFIQFAHFGTFEMWLTLFSVLLFWYCLQVIEGKKLRSLFLLGSVFGILVAIKISSLALFPLPTLAIFLQYKKCFSVSNNTTLWKRIMFGLLLLLKLLGKLLIFLLLALSLYVITNPYIIFDQTSFISSMNYESNVGLGTLPVFYTGGFFETIPVVYQFLHVYPFLINPLITFLFIPALLVIIFVAIRTKSVTSLFLVFSFLLLFASQSILFVKWTRYLIPTLPFIYIILALSFSLLYLSNKQNKKSNNILDFVHTIFLSIVVISAIIFSFSYFKTAFVNSDTRIEALVFAKTHIPLDTPILSEPYDLGIVPFQNNFTHLDWFNFYELDNHSLDATEAVLQQKLATDQYIILPSQRILQPRIENKKRFPKAHTFYSSLFNGKLGYHKIYETPCDIFCQITYQGDPVYWFEQTTNVFERPTVFIFKN